MTIRMKRGLGGAWLACLVLGVAGAGCGTTGTSKDNEQERFATSGSPEADQRAEQRVSDANKREEAIREAEKDDEKRVERLREESNRETSGQGRKGAAREVASERSEPDEPEAKQTLYDRLGGEPAVRAIVDDFLKRALEDPRVNWTRSGVRQGGFLRRNKTVEWEQTPANVLRMKEHFVQFLSLAAGGPVQYSGKPIKPLHAEMQITKAEFDATIGDLKATLDKLKVNDALQKEVLAIFESTRPQIVTER